MRNKCSPSVGLGLHRLGFDSSPVASPVLVVSDVSTSISSAGVAAAQASAHKTRESITRSGAGIESSALIDVPRSETGLTSGGFRDSSCGYFDHCSLLETKVDRGVRVVTVRNTAIVVCRETSLRAR